MSAIHKVLHSCGFWLFAQLVPFGTSAVAGNFKRKKLRTRNQNFNKFLWFKVPAFPKLFPGFLEKVLPWTAVSPHCAVLRNRKANKKKRIISGHVTMAHIQNAYCSTGAAWIYETGSYAQQTLMKNQRATCAFLPWTKQTKKIKM